MTLEIFVCHRNMGEHDIHCLPSSSTKKKQKNKKNKKKKLKDLLPKQIRVQTDVNVTSSRRHSAKVLSTKVPQAFPAF